MPLYLLVLTVIYLSGLVVAQRPIHVNTNAVHTTVDSHFLSVTLDMGMFVPGAPFWNDPLRASGHFPFENRALRTLSRQLSPAWLRVGGTTADRSFYHLPGTENHHRDGYRYILSHTIIDDMLDFSLSAGLDVLFNINSGAGPRNGMPDSAWNGTNAQALIQYIVQHPKGHVVRGWHLGNEPELYPPELSVTASRLSRDYAAFHQMIHRIYETSHLRTPLIVGPCSINYGHPIFGGFIAQAGNYIDAVSYNFYPLTSSWCAAADNPGHSTIEKAIGPSVIDSFAGIANNIQGIVRRSFPSRNLPLWLVESGLSVCGGQSGVDDRYVYLLTFLNSMASTAFQSLQVHCHQSLIGSYCKKTT